MVWERDLVDGIFYTHPFVNVLPYRMDSALEVGGLLIPVALIAALIVLVV